MTPNNPLEIMLAHDRWAMGNLFAAAKGLSDAQLDEAFDIGHGSLRATLVHCAQVMMGWLDAMRNQPQQPAIDVRMTMGALGEKYMEVVEEFAAFARGGSMEDILTPTRGQQKMSAPRGAMITHLLTHQMHHRAQALNMLRKLNVKLPQSSVLEWMFATGKASR